jgi:hypothetical protein
MPSSSQSRYIPWVALFGMIMLALYCMDQYLVAFHKIAAPVVSNIALPGMLGAGGLILLFIDSSGALLTTIEKLLAASPKTLDTSKEPKV